MRRPKVAIIGSCVTRDVWNLAGFEDDARPDLLYVARTSFASLFAPPVPGVVQPETPPADLTPWEARIVYDDLLKRAADRVADYAPTHLIIDLIEERFELLRSEATVATFSWELHRSGLRDSPPIAPLRQVSRHSDEAFELWRPGVEAFTTFLKARLPQTRVIFHDARWASHYLDEDGDRQPFDPDRMLWPGIPARIDDHNRVLARYAKTLRAALPAAFYVRAPGELLIGDAKHRWGLSPFHYAEPYYRYVWSRFQTLGCDPRTA